MQTDNVSEVFLIKTADRATGVKRLFDEFDLNNFRSKRVALKANFNSADPFPASTHPDTLRTIVEILKNAGTDKITLAERSGMGVTRLVLQALGVFDLAEELGFNVIVSDELGKDGWVNFTHDGTHWSQGFYIAKCFVDADVVVQTCCLKTHRFGGHFTLSLKNSVGLVARRVPGQLHDYMSELHTSRFQRHMIAEINKQYNTDVIAMDGIRAFITGGPERGEIVEPNLLLASKDRVALDAVGVALLKIYGATGNIEENKIFELDQIRRAAELEIGAKSVGEIQLTPLNNDSKADITKIQKVFAAEV
ncbi:MAG TPA: DUF362 domain-containing protein [Candidatus Sulfotelmatobacter sp.]|nr:DUF362 domain-containing protein [Candidatus Sulfotelmatobacter sp.]